MARDFFINGESLVLVLGAPATGIGTLQQLGLAVGDVTITPNFKHLDINVDAWGEAPADVQWMLADVTIAMTLVHFDRTVLDTVLALSMGGGQSAVGQMARAGRRLGSNTASLVNGNSYIRLNIASPIGQKPWRFFSSYLQGPGMEMPLGTKRSLMQLNWRAVPFTTDPAQVNAGFIFGATNYPLWDHALDT